MMLEVLSILSIPTKEVDERGISELITKQCPRSPSYRKGFQEAGRRVRCLEDSTRFTQEKAWMAIAEVQKCQKQLLFLMVQCRWRKGLDPGDRLPRKLHYIDFSHSSKINYGCDTLVRHRIHLLPAPARHHPSPL